MELLIVRHAIALDPGEFGLKNDNDDLRPLSARGRERMVQGARGIGALMSQVDRIVTSPLTRAQQTSEYLFKVFPRAQRQVDSILRPENSPKKFLPWLKSLAMGQDSSLCIVGHEPHLSLLCGYLFTQREVSFLEFKKGGACLIRFYTDPPQGGYCQLQWHLKPRQLRVLGSTGPPRNP